jgi:copper homeostasis protein
MIFELCTDSLEGALAANRFGVKRIELCSALSIGGLTPNYGLIKQCVTKANVEVHVMIRPREGNFFYTKEEIELMKTDIDIANQIGVQGVVFGVLDKKNEVSIINKELLEYAKSLNLQVTFHRAFDLVSNYKKAIEKIIEFGFDRLLTSGLQETAEQGLGVISHLQKNYGYKIEIMAGSGINPSNVLKIANLGIKNLHFTARKFFDKSSRLDMGKQMKTDSDKIKNIVKQF